MPTPAADPSGGPAVIITLLVTAGTKHPYRVDAKYLRKRGVEVEGMDPFNVSVYQLKELILRDWREEWEPRPSSPNAIRLIHFGRYLEDNAYLKGKPAPIPGRPSAARHRQLTLSQIAASTLVLPTSSTWPSSPPSSPTTTTPTPPKRKRAPGRGATEVMTSGRLGVGVSFSE